MYSLKFMKDICYWVSTLFANKNISEKIIEFSFRQKASLRHSLVHFAVVGYDVLCPLPEVAGLVVLLRHDRLVDCVHAARQIRVPMRQLSVADKCVKHVLHVLHEADLVLVRRLVSSENRRDVGGRIGDAAQLSGSFLSCDVRVNVGDEVLGNEIGQMLKRANGSDVGEHGRVFLPVVSLVLAVFGVVVDGHRLSGDGRVEAAELAFNVSGVGVAVVPVHELLVVTCHIALGSSTWERINVGIF